MATSLKPITQNPSSSPCLCLHSSRSLYASTASPSYKNRTKRTKQKVDLTTSFLQEQISYEKMILTKRIKKKKKKMAIVDEVGGQYEDTFNDVKMELIDYFTFKAVRTVLEQLYEMNPPQYIWFNNFVADNVPNKGTRFLQILVKERRELAERVMITRLTLYGRWIKKCDHGEIYQEISDENLKLLRDRLMETIVWPSDENNNQKNKD